MAEMLTDQARVAAYGQCRILSAGNGRGDYPTVSEEEMRYYMNTFRASGADSLPGVVIDIPINEAKVLAVEARFLRRQLLQTLYGVMALRLIDPNRKEI